MDWRCRFGWHAPEIIAQCDLGVCGCDKDTCHGPEECPEWQEDCGCAPLQECKRCKATRTWGPWVRGLQEG